MRIGLLSDTHGYLDPKIMFHFKECDEIWHAGDIGSTEISDQLSSLKNLRGVYGNIDGKEIRLIHPEDQIFMCEKVKVYITHIGGYPGNYYQGVEKKIDTINPRIFICGHSHILKVMNDSKHNLLHMNPGAAGKHGFHKFRTILRFKIHDDRITDLEAIELGLRSEIN